MYPSKYIMNKPYSVDDHEFDWQLCRRSFLKAGALALCGCLFPQAALGAAKNMVPSQRSLSIFNQHTGESLEKVYWSRGRYIPDALAEINRIMRDHRTDEVIPMDTGLLDLLHAIHCRMGSQEMLQIISGYRSPVTNRHLRECGRGVAKNSLHMEGMAADICLPDKSLSELRETAVALKCGGVGYYPRSGFVHVDVGSVRYW